MSNITVLSLDHNSINLLALFVRIYLSIVSIMIGAISLIGIVDRVFCQPKTLTFDQLLYQLSIDVTVIVCDVLGKVGHGVE